MPGHVETDTADGIRILTMGGTAGNTLSPGLRRALLDALERAEADTAVRGVVLTGAGGTFCAGINVLEYGAALEPPWIGALARRIEDLGKPVVAAIEGAALGAGFALALACHARVAQRAARVALPDIRLGLLPSGGATQRLPRLVGVQVSLALVMPGRPFAVSEIGLKRVFHQLTEGAPVDAALSLTARLADAGKWPRTCDATVGMSDPQGYMRALSTVAAKLTEDASPEAAILRALEAALLLPFEQGCALEDVLFDDCRKAPAARAARNLMLAERRATSVPGVDPAAAQPVSDVVISGRRGAFVETSIMSLDAGWQVHLALPNPNDTPALRARITQVYNGAVDRNRMDAAARDRRLERLRTVGPEDAHAAAQIAFELGGAGTELPGAPVRVRVTEGDDVRPGTAAPPLWLRLYPPAHTAPLAELAIAEHAAPQAVATLVQALSRAGKTIIRSGIFPGMIGRNLDWALWSAALALGDAGADPYAIDAAAQEMGYAQGPFRQMDSEGLAVAAARLDHLSAARGAPALDEAGAIRRLSRAGQTGRRAGRGFYLYEGDKVRRDSGLTERLKEVGARSVEDAMDDADIPQALEAAIVNEAARLIATGAAYSAGDIDVVLVRGRGVDRAKGGVLIQADLRGMFTVLRQMKARAGLAPHIWTPHALVHDMVKNGTGFFGRG